MEYLHQFTIGMESLNEKIRRIRKQSGLSQIEVAKLAGINQASYSNLENGDTKSISIEVGKGISKALNIPFNELFDIEISKTDTELIESLKYENDKLKKEINDKSMLVDLLTKEKTILTEFWLTMWISDFSFAMSFIDDLISKATTETDRQSLLQKRNDIKRIFYKNKDYCIRVNHFSESDFENHFKEIKTYSQSNLHREDYV